jgi:pancreatic triacylglycerol lipase
LRFETLQVIGHSLGGQIAGLTGKRVTRGKIQVIISLDPAGLLFNLRDEHERVASGDAVYVEVIHTNSGRLGFAEPTGDADFFPNFGVIMPGCESDLTGQCSHSRSTMYYAESINERFTSIECTSFAEIQNNICTPTGRNASLGGANGNIGLTGLFFLSTHAESPFSRG